mgnify:CR=1 FL=1
MKFADILKTKQLKENDLGLKAPVKEILKIHDILKRDYPNSDIIKDYPIASAFYHYINSKWK